MYMTVMCTEANIKSTSYPLRDPGATLQVRLHVLAVAVIIG